MVISPTLPALAMLLSFPHLGLFRHVTPAPPDTLPPLWKSASRLALEDQLVLSTLPPLGPFRGPKLAVQQTLEPRRMRLTADPDSSALVIQPVYGDTPIGLASRVSMLAYAHQLTLLNLPRLWKEKSIQNVNSLGANTPAAARSGLSFALPSPLPARVQSLLGPGGPALNVSGSENIVLSGQSNWTNEQVGLLGQRKSLFPTLDMQQNLDIRLEGQLSDRIKVNLLQNSLNQLPLSNRIAINYKGEEDDLIQEFDLGNTNLSLPGTQYVSYSGRNEGLFGMKAAGRVGPLDLTLLASKQEGRSERASFGGGASKQSNSIPDADYVRGMYFFLYDPNVATRLVDETTLLVYITPPTISTDQNLIRGKAMVDPNSGASPAVYGSFRQLTAGTDKDYEIISTLYGPNFKVLHLRQPVDPRQCLAVSYRASFVNASGLPAGAPFDVGGSDSTLGDGTRQRVLLLVRPPEDSLAKDVSGGLGSATVYADTGAFQITRELELRNVYQLGGSGIDPKTFTISVRRGTDQPPTTSIQTSGGPVPYIEAIGLDNFDESHGAPAPGHDGQLDGTAPGGGSQLRTAVDFDNGVLFLPDPRPFSPRLGAAGQPFDNLVDSFLLRRQKLTGPPDSSNGANEKIYRKYINQGAYDAEYYIDVGFTAASVGNTIQLGSGNVLPGSDVVSVNGVAWQRDRDYTIDYDLGRVVLKKGVRSSDNLNIDYSYAPLFQQAGRTLLGSAFHLEGREKSAGGAFLYESRGAQDLRPRLGEEPSRSVIGDLNGDWTAHPRWITQLVDRLPGIRTTAPSDFHIQGEMGASFPNPNTRNEVYIDDMEGVRDAVPLSMIPDRWQWSSVPSRMVTGLPQSMNGLDHQHDAEVHWFLPPTFVHEKDLKPTLTLAQGGELARQVLAISLPRRPTSARNDFAGGNFDTLWAGLTYLLDPAGIDLSRSQFIELWVNDFNDEHDSRHPEPRVRGRNVKLHIDLGRVSEDMQRAPDEPPNGLLDTEDRNRDGQLQVTGEIYEDTGYDGKMDPGNAKHPGDIAESGPIRDLVTASAEDPEGDTYRGVNGNFAEIDPSYFRFSNGTEGNKLNNHPNPDTEDLNGNGILDTGEAYAEYTIDLGDTSATYRYLAQGGDLQKERAKGTPGYVGLSSDNGWRRYRIPISDSLRQDFGHPDFTLTQHVRIWLEGVVNTDPDPDSLGAPQSKTVPVRPFLMLGSLDIVGSRWQINPLDSNTTAHGTKVTLNSVNSVDNSNIYTPPFDPGQTLNGNQALTRREQSLSLEFESLHPSDTISVFKTFSIDEDYTRYGKLNWYAAGYQVSGYVAGVDSLEYFVRFASDETERSYYEYRAPLPPSSGDRSIAWRQVVLRLAALSNLKLNRDFPHTEPILYEAPGEHPGETYVIKGRPSFTRIRRISIGLINAATNPLRVYDTGQLWFDELRATDVAKDAGHAERLLVTGKLANLMNYNLSYNGRDADFLSVGENRGQGVNSTQLNFAGSLDLHRFFEGTGIALPVGYAYSRNSQQPRYSAGDDVVRTDQQSAASETRSESRSWTASYSRQWSDRSNPFLRYTLGGIGATIARSQSVSRNPSSVDTTTSTSGAVNYGIGPRNLFSLPLPGMKARLFPLPEKIYWNYSIATRESHTYDRLSDSTRSLVLRNAVNGRSSFLAFGGDFRPVQMIHQHFEGTRNLGLGDLNQKVGPLNLGRMVNWRQNLDASYTFQRHPWFKPMLGWSASYTQNNGPELSPDLSVRSISNGQSVNLTWALPFDRLGTVPAVTDSSRRRARPPALLAFISRLGEVGTDASFSTSSGYSRLIGSPSLGYLLGLTHDPGLRSDSTGRVRPVFGNVSGDQSTFRTSARSRLLLGLGSSLNTRGDYSTRTSTQNAVKHFSVESHFPDLDVDYGRVATAIRLSRILHDPHLRTGYSRSTQSEFQGAENDRVSVATSTAWAPLIGLDGSFKNGTRAEFKLDSRSSRREDLLLGRSITEDHNTNVSLNLTRTYTQGQKVVFLGKETTVHSTVTLGMAGTYSRRTAETHRDSYAGRLFPIGEDRLDLNGNGSYAFSNNVTGHVLLGFGQTRDLLRDVVRRNVRVEVRGQFTF